MYLWLTDNPAVGNVECHVFGQGVELDAGLARRGDPIHGTGQIIGMGSRRKVWMCRPQRDIQNENPGSLVFVIIYRKESGPRNAEGVFLTHRRISIRKTDTHLKVTRKESEIHYFNRGICAVYLGCHGYRCGYGEIIRHGDLFVGLCPVFERLPVDKEQSHLQIRPYRILPRKCGALTDRKYRRSSTVAEKFDLESRVPHIAHPQGGYGICRGICQQSGETASVSIGCQIAG